MKKKILVIMLVVAIAMASVFAAGKFHLGAAAGSASMTETRFEQGLVQNTSGTKVGLGVDLRVDYDITSEATVTGVVGWQMPDRTFLTKTPAEPEKQQHYLSIFVGYTFDAIMPELETLNGDPIDLKWKMSIGPELLINLCSGKVGVGGGAIFRGQFGLADNLGLDISVKDTFVAINDKADGTWAPYNNVSTKLGCTYNF